MQQCETLIGNIHVYNQAPPDSSRSKADDQRTLGDTSSFYSQELNTIQSRENNSVPPPTNQKSASESLHEHVRPEEAEVSITYCWR